MQVARGPATGSDAACSSAVVHLLKQVITYLHAVTTRGCAGMGILAKLEYKIGLLSLCVILMCE